MKILSFLRASSRTRTCFSKDKCLVLDSSRARFTPSTIPSTPVEGYPFHSVLCSQWFLKFSTPRAIPDFVGFLPSRALGLRVSYRPCSPKKPPRRSRDNHGFTHGQVNFSAKNIHSIAVRRFTPLGHLASILATRSGVDASLAPLLRKSSPKRNSICTVQTPGVAGLSSDDEIANVTGVDSPGLISFAELKASYIGVPCCV